MFSLIIHCCILGILIKTSLYSQPTPYISKEKSIRVEFVKQEQQNTIKKLVEVIEPTDEVPSKTENIAEANSISSAPVKSEGDIPGPPLVENPKIETLGSETEKMQVANIIPQTKKTTKIQHKEAVKNNFPMGAILHREKGGTILPKKEDNTNDEKLIKEQSPEEIVEPEYSGKAFQNPQGKIYNQVKKEGILGFEAIQDQLAPYLKEIQRKVEKYWLHYLLTRYSGTKPTEVVIDCEISSEGKIVKIDIIGEPEDLLFAGICKQALQKSAPFSPFPFQVPDIYKNRNLQIRWTFSFL
ncbi:MAG: hypothetical protein ACP5QY_05620 [Candidatus Hydrogenedens sp.]